MAWDAFPGVGLITQFDGSPLAGKNCAAAGAAMHLVSERQGRRPAKGSPWYPTGASFRAATGDTVGGLLASQVDATANRVYGIDIDYRIAAASEVAARLRAGYPVSFLHRFAPIRDAGFRGSGSFGENHYTFLSGIRADNAVRDLDPMFNGRRSDVPRGPQWVPWSAIVRAGELLVIADNGQRMIDRYGAAMLYVGFGRVPYRPAAPTTYLRYSVTFSGASFWTYSVVRGVIVGRAARAFNGPTSARCGAPSVYSWPGHSGRRLVRMAAGALEGQYVAVNQGGAVLRETEVKA